jgi:hypothetical protein
MPGIEGAEVEGASMNLGQVSASMGTGADASKALGSAAEAASEAGSGIAEAAAMAAAASQEAAAAMGVMTGMSMQEMVVGHEVAGMSMEAIAASEAAGAAAMAAAAAQIATENLSELVHDATVGQGSGAPGAGPAVDTSIQSQGTGEPMPGE